MYKPLITDSSKKYGNNRWLAYSNKIKRTVYLFSDLEYEHWLKIESDPDIIEFCEQPIKMEIIDNGKVISSIIDMWVKYKNDQEAFIEIKYRKDLSKISVMRQIYIQEVWCKVNKTNHLIRTEDDIKMKPIKLSNLKFLIKQVNNFKQVNNSVDFNESTLTFLEEAPSSIFKFDTLNFDNRYFEKRELIMILQNLIEDKSETEVRLVLNIANAIFNTYKG